MNPKSTVKSLYARLMIPVDKGRRQSTYSPCDTQRLLLGQGDSKDLLDSLHPLLFALTDLDQFRLASHISLDLWPGKHDLPDDLTAHLAPQELHYDGPPDLEIRVVETGAGIVIHDSKIRMQELYFRKAVERVPLHRRPVAVLVDPEFLGLVYGVWNGAVVEADLLRAEVVLWLIVDKGERTRGTITTEGYIKAVL